jgi:hypothetical protein
MTKEPGKVERIFKHLVLCPATAPSLLSTQLYQYLSSGSQGSEAFRHFNRVQSNRSNGSRWDYAEIYVAP